MNGCSDDNAVTPFSNIHRLETPNRTGIIRKGMRAVLATGMATYRLYVNAGDEEGPTKLRQEGTWKLYIQCRSNAMDEDDIEKLTECPWFGRLHARRAGGREAPGFELSFFPPMAHSLSPL